MPGTKHRNIKKLIEHNPILSTYFVQEQKINKMLFYTKIYCKYNCHYSPIGCCYYNWDKIRAKKDDILKKARKSSGLKKENNKGACPWHSSTRGCVLEYFRSPVCVGMMCPSILNIIKKNFGITYASSLITKHLYDIIEGRMTAQKIAVFDRKINRLTKLFSKNQDVFRKPVARKRNG